MNAKCTYRPRRLPYLIIGLLLFGTAVPLRALASRPNILLMMVDDLGFSDFGCYGGEIETPHIDRLAENGLRFSNFYNTAKCHSSRVCLLTGLYCYQAGNQKLNRSVTIAEVLGKAGYFTAMTGKWHLDDQPTDHGFERYFGHLSGATDFFKGDKTFRLNGQPWNDFDEDFYTTDALVDYAIDFIQEALDQEKPFFHYIAFNAPHYPLQAPKEDIRKYLGRYDTGWDVIRAARLRKQKQLGLFDAKLKLPPLPAHMTPWDSLGTKEKQWESFRMAIFAAMVDRIDQNIGRLVTFLKEQGQLDNTLIMLCSDNGGCPFERSKNINIPPWQAGSYYLYDASWAAVSNTPLRHYKQNQYEGGISSPLVVHWPGQLKNTGSWVREPGHLIDIMATCLDVTGGRYPKTFGTETIEPLQGKSLLPLWRGQSRPGHEWLYFQFSTDRAIRKDHWKLVSFRGHAWELYNIVDDRCEQHNLASVFPDKVKELSALWRRVARDVDKAPKRVYAPVKDKPSPDVNKTWHKPDEFKNWTMPSFEPEGDTEITISGKPLSYWIAQASNTARAEPMERVVQALSQAVTNENPTTKVAASDALATLGLAAKPAVPVLLDQLGHELGWVRAAAAGAVAAVGKEAVPVIQTLVEEQIGAPSVRAAFILGAIGPDAKAAIPTLVALRKEASEVLQVLYSEILNQIDPVNFPGNTSSDTLQAGRVKLTNDGVGSVWSSRSRDWPQYHGPRRDSICHERGLLKQWPEEGPRQLWTLKGLGKGYSSLAIAGGRIITMGDRSAEAGEAQYVTAYDLNTRRELWATKVGPVFNDGPRSTPTVVGKSVYVLGTEGDLLCVESENGKLRWRRNLAEDFQGQMMSGWKYSESLLVDGSRLICTPGGRDAALVALDRFTGKLLWKCALPDMGKKGKDGAGYSSAVIAEIHGVRQVVQMLGRGVVGIDMATGKFLWGYNRIACKVANITSPIVRGNYVFVTNAYNTGSALLEIKRSGDTFSAEELYFLSARDFQNHHGGVVLIDGHLYGGRGANAGHPTCIDLATGKVRWAERSPARGSAGVIYADGHLIFRYDRGEVILLEATPESMRIKGRFTAVKGDGAAWAHPVIHQGRLYLRHGDLLACYDLREMN